MTFTASLSNDKHSRNTRLQKRTYFLLLHQQENLESMFFTEFQHRKKRYKNFQTNKADTNQVDYKIDSQHVGLQFEQYYVYYNGANG